MLSPGAPFSSGGKYYIAGAVKSCFAGIFQNGDDETYPNDLHGNIIADTKGCAGDWNQKQRASGYTGCTAGTYCGNDTQQERGGEIHNYAQCICCLLYTSRCV